MLENVTPVTSSQLLANVETLKAGGYRFVTMTCLDAGATYEVLYHFDKDYQLKHLRLTLPKGESLPSISCVLFAALVIENEIKDMFGIALTDLAIDFNGRLLLSEDAPKAPLNKTTSGVGVDLRVKEPAAAAGGGATP